VVAAEEQEEEASNDKNPSYLQRKKPPAWMLQDFESAFHIGKFYNRSLLYAKPLFLHELFLTVCEI
jgi:hypothetical protein